MMSKKLAFELAVIIFAVAVVSYFYGLSVGVQNGLQLGSTALQPEENKYKDMFLVDPFGQDTNLLISQEFMGTVKGISGDMITIDTYAGALTINFNKDDIAIYKCNNPERFSNCSKSTEEISVLIGKKVKVTAFREESGYRISIISYLQV